MGYSKAKVNVMPPMPPYCRCCGFNLTIEEVYFYGIHCEPCVREEFERVDAWRHGAPDPALDRKYGGRIARAPALNS